MKLKYKFIIGYILIGIIFAMYAWIFGNADVHRSFAYTIGQCIVWPALIFPVIGKIIGGIVVIAIVLFITFS